MELGIVFLVVVVSVVVIVVIAATASSRNRLASDSTGAGGWAPAFTGSAGPTMGYPGLLQGGVPARGILLKVGSQRSARGTASQGYYEVRAVTVDVEVPGRAPYRCDGSLYVPANLRRLVLPGATVELRVDPSGSRNMALFGPGVGLAAALYS